MDYISILAAPVVRFYGRLIEHYAFSRIIHWTVETYAGLTCYMLESRNIRWTALNFCLKHAEITVQRMIEEKQGFRWKAIYTRTLLPASPEAG